MKVHVVAAVGISLVAFGFSIAAFSIAVIALLR